MDVTIRQARELQSRLCIKCVHEADFRARKENPCPLIGDAGIYGRVREWSWSGNHMACAWFKDEDGGGR